jgi:hypothetical protein
MNITNLIKELNSKSILEIEKWTKDRLYGNNKIPYSDQADSETCTTVLAEILKQCPEYNKICFTIQDTLNWFIITDLIHRLKSTGDMNQTPECECLKQKFRHIAFILDYSKPKYLIGTTRLLLQFILDDVDKFRPIFPDILRAYYSLNILDVNDLPMWYHIRDNYKIGEAYANQAIMRIEVDSKFDDRR